MPPAERDPTAIPRVLMIRKRVRGRGGMQQQARRVALRMRRRAVPVTLITHAQTRPRYPFMWEERLPTRTLLAPNRWAFARELYAYLLRYRESFDVVHLHGFGLETFAAMAARRAMGKPLLVKPSTAGPGTKLDRYGAFCSRIPGSARWWLPVDAWVSISEQTTSDLLRMGVRKERIVFIPNGVNMDQHRPLDPAARAALRAEFGVGPETRVVCTAARVTPHKRVDLLIRAFLRLPTDLGDLQLWVMGDGEQMPELKELVRESGAGNRVKLLGHLMSRHAVLRFQAADAFALVSLWEGLSNALLEAMACGLAPVVTDASGMRDVVRHQENGLLVPANDEEATAAALETLFRQPELRTALGSAALRTVKQRYSLDSTVDRLLAVYEACRSGKPLPTWSG